MSRLRKIIVESLSYRKGITLLLVILVLASLMTISIGIFNVAFTELVIAGDLNSSFRALNAADQGMELMIYRHKVQYAGWETNTTYCPGGASSPCSPAIGIDTWKLPNGTTCVLGKYDVLMTHDGNQTVTITSTGNSTNASSCVDTPKSTKRAIRTTYKF